MCSSDLHHRRRVGRRICHPDFRNCQCRSDHAISFHICLRFIHATSCVKLFFLKNDLNFFPLYAHLSTNSDTVILYFFAQLFFVENSDFSDIHRFYPHFQQLSNVLSTNGLILHRNICPRSQSYPHFHRLSTSCVKPFFVTNL